MIPNVTIVTLGESLDAWASMIEAVAASIGISTCRRPSTFCAQTDGIVFVCAPNSTLILPPLRDEPTILIELSDEGAVERRVRFSGNATVPPTFRNRAIATHMPALRCTLRRSAAVLAETDTGPCWTSSMVGDHRHDSFIAFRNAFQKDDRAFQWLTPLRFMQLLPLVEWLRVVSGWYTWLRPPAKACFMFDDPNLHSTRYGFVNFDQLAREGRQHGYHTSFATVPLDAFYVKREAAEMFSRNRDSISLLIHGNNHTRRELAARPTLVDSTALMRQAIRRATRLELKFGVSVSKVMAPPHGVCSEEMIAGMAQAGFEAVCVSHGSVHAGNPGVDWTKGMGVMPIIGVRGLPVISRFGWDRDVDVKISLAAYFGHPIIPVGHHWDLADGPDVLATISHKINALGTVEWGDMTFVARGNYAYKVQAGTLRLRSYSRVLQIDVPKEVDRIEVDAAWRNSQGWRIRNLNRAPLDSGKFEQRDENCSHFSVIPDSRIELSASPCEFQVAKDLPDPSTSLGAIGRRILVEFRDRTMPLLPRAWARK